MYCVQQIKNATSRLPIRSDASVAALVAAYVAALVAAYVAASVAAYVAASVAAFVTALVAASVAASVAADVAASVAASVAAHVAAYVAADVAASVAAHVAAYVAASVAASVAALVAAYVAASVAASAGSPDIEGSAGNDSPRRCARPTTIALETAGPTAAISSGSSTSRPKSAACFSRCSRSHQTPAATLAAIAALIGDATNTPRCSGTSSRFAAS